MRNGSRKVKVCLHFKHSTIHPTGHAAYRVWQFSKPWIRNRDTETLFSCSPWPTTLTRANILIFLNYRFKSSLLRTLPSLRTTSTYTVGERVVVSHARCEITSAMLLAYARLAGLEMELINFMLSSTAVRLLLRQGRRLASLVLNTHSYLVHIQWPLLLLAPED